MKSSMKLSLVTVLLVLSGSAIAQTEVPVNEYKITVNQAVEYAISGNLSLRQSQIQLESSQRAKDNSWNSLLPNIRGSASYSNNLSQSTASQSLTLSANANFALSPALYTAVNGARLNYENQLIAFENAKRTLEKNVRSTYYSLLYQQANLSLLESNVTSTKNQYNTNLRKYNVGALPRLDVLTAQYNYQNAESTLASQKLNFENSKNSFKQLLGIPFDAELVLDGSLDDFLNIGEISLEGIQTASANVKTLEKQLEIAENSLLATRFSAWGPSITAGISYSYAGNDRTGDWAFADNGPNLSLGASIPLDGYLPWSSGSQSIQNQKANVANLELQLESAKLTQQMNIQMYLNQVNLERSNISLRQQSISVAQQTYSMTVDAYNRGSKDLLALQTSSNNLLQAKVNLQLEAYNMANALLNLEDVAGIPFGTLGK